jgi:hypothetical protein
MSLKQERRRLSEQRPYALHGSTSEFDDMGYLGISDCAPLDNYREDIRRKGGVNHIPYLTTNLTIAVTWNTRRKISFLLT